MNHVTVLPFSLREGKVEGKGKARQGEGGGEGEEEERGKGRRGNGKRKGKKGKVIRKTEQYQPVRLYGGLLVSAVPTIEVKGLLAEGTAVLVFVNCILQHVLAIYFGMLSSS